MDCGTVPLIGSLHFNFLSVNLIPGASLCQTVVSCFLQRICSSKGNGDLASPTAQPPEGCGERELLWSPHIPGWIRTGNQSRNRIRPSLLSLSNPAAPSQRHPQHFLLQLEWPCYVGDRGALWKSGRSFVHHTFSRAVQRAGPETRGCNQNSSVQICKPIQIRKANGQPVT